MYSRISDNSSYLEESIEASGVKEYTNSKVSGASAPLANLKDLVKIKIEPSNNQSNSLDNFFITPIITDGNIPNMENQVFDSSIGKFVNKNSTSEQSNKPEPTTESRVYHKKVANLRDFKETLIPPGFVYPFNPYGSNPTSIALIRINNNYKLLSCRSSNEFELIKQLHGIMYSNTKHFNLEYTMIENINLGYLVGELDSYGFLKYDDIQDDLTVIGANIKQLADARKALGCQVPTPKNTIINVMPSFQTMHSMISQIGNHTGEIIGSNLFGNGKHFASEDYATVDPSFDTKRTMDIWYNHMFMSGFIIEWEAMLKQCNISSENVKQLEYFKEISIYKPVDVDGLVIQELENLFNTELFNDKAQFQEKVDMILTRNNKTCPNLLQIKQYILDNYNLDSDVEHRIQFTTLLNEVSKGLNVASEYTEMMKKSLPLVLVELNLNKKRYSSGFFWYGLVKKHIPEVRLDTRNGFPNIYDTSCIGKTTEDYSLFPILNKKKESADVELQYKNYVANRGYDTI